jgi:hypothetical protein
MVRSPGTDLAMVWLMFGSRIAAEEWVRRYKAKCEADGTKYVRSDAIEHAAKLFNMDPRSLSNWMRRSKRSR